MLSAVGLDDQSRFQTREIDDVWLDYHLAPEFVPRHPSRPQVLP